MSTGSSIDESAPTPAYGEHLEASARPLGGRVAIVTGASRGIGTALARGVAAAGARVAVVSRTAEGCSVAVAAIESVGGEALPIVADLGTDQGAEDVVDATLDAWGSVDVVVNNAGLLQPHLVTKITSDEIDRLLAVNFRGPFRLCQYAFPHLVKTRGSIVNISALCALRGMTGIGAYAASKAAMLAMTRTMAREWGLQGVRVNAVVPGGVATDMILPRDPDEREAFVAEMSSTNALGRLATPEDLVGPVVFMASDAAAYVTGQALQVDGGAFG